MPIENQTAPSAPPALEKGPEFFGPISNAPAADWKVRVETAKNSTDRAALLQEAIGLTVLDVTAANANDSSPTAKSLTAFSSAHPIINYDENLNQKSSPIDKRILKENAGYVLHSGGRHYVILGRNAIDPERYYYPLTVLNHEFDHIRQSQTKSALHGNAAELDAWTRSFIRDFHHTYLLGMKTDTTCVVQSISTFAPLLDYYHRSSISEAQRDRAVQQIVDYYRTVVSPHEGHRPVFRFWIYRTLKNVALTPNLADRLNTELGLGVRVEEDMKAARQFPCGTVRSISYSPPVLDIPTDSTP